MTVQKLKDIEKVVELILKNVPQTREDDFLLYAEIIRRYNPKLLELPAMTFLVSHNAYSVPNIKSVERARRKVQEKHPELASERAKRKRAKAEQTYFEYSVRA
jgi:hypothetical protein